MQIAKAVKACLTLAFLGTIGFVMLPLGSRSVAASAGPGVTVTNVPLPVQGAVSVNNLPAVQSVGGTVAVSNLPATQVVTGTVNVGNTPAVSLSGPIDVSNATDTNGNPVLVTEDDSARTAFNLERGCQPSNNCVFPFSAVPAGQIEVIESLAGSCQLDSGTSLFAVRAFGQFGNGIAAELDAIPTPPVTITYFSEPVYQTYGQSNKIYLFPGETLNVYLLINGAESPQANCSVNIAGYVVKQ